LWRQQGTSFFLSVCLSFFLSFFLLLVEREGCINVLIDIAERNKVHLLRGTAFYALGLVATTRYFFLFCVSIFLSFFLSFFLFLVEQEGCINVLIDIAERNKVHSLRGTAFYALGLVATTRYFIQSVCLSVSLSVTFSFFFFLSGGLHQCPDIYRRKKQSSFSERNSLLCARTCGDNKVLFCLSFCHFPFLLLVKREGCINVLKDIAERNKVHSLRGTAFYTLGLVATTRYFLLFVCLSVFLSHLTHLTPLTPLTYLTHLTHLILLIFQTWL
jgi:hypothetical protein